MMIYSIQRQLEFEAEFDRLKEKYFVDDRFILDHIEERGVSSSQAELINSDAIDLYDMLCILVNAIDDDEVDECYLEACNYVVNYKVYS